MEEFNTNQNLRYKYAENLVKKPVRFYICLVLDILFLALFIYLCYKIKRFDTQVLVRALMVAVSAMPIYLAMFITTDIMMSRGKFFFEREKEKIVLYKNAIDYRYKPRKSEDKLNRRCKEIRIIIPLDKIYEIDVDEEQYRFTLTADYKLCSTYRNGDIEVDEFEYKTLTIGNYFDNINKLLKKVKEQVIENGEILI